MTPQAYVCIHLFFRQVTVEKLTIKSQSKEMNEIGKFGLYTKRPC